MKANICLLLATLALALFLPANARARGVYPDRGLGDIYVLSTEGSRALLKAKGAEKEYVDIGDIIGEERMAVMKIDSLSVTVKSGYGDTETRLPVGGGMGF